ncbi:hypothetical protein GCM10011348_29160 [Marinobacterium nitratireducens]|uniref:SnoaL-like domain-containing protein n=1 Tax=Marinobacterium nitratireducens TaxID=518897 RepID=A0A917ZIW6_9GAMM|nr:nuclear transport factor 2 family protein [Marinobacterium nitratireducens]GGO83980.1 hypothetical protein GCM10011348_29160 [Marinobacterium nitratireducens]
MINVKTLRGLAVAATLILGTEMAIAGDASVLAQRFEATENAVNAKDAKAWAEAMYADNVVVVGEGSQQPIRGLAALLPVMEEIVAGAQSCSIEMNDAVVGAEQASTFATWSCTPVEGEPYQVRALYVWEQQKVGWRVIAEMYGMGNM